MPGLRPDGRPSSTAPAGCCCPRSSTPTCTSTRWASARRSTPRVATRAARTPATSPGRSPRRTRRSGPTPCEDVAARARRGGRAARADGTTRIRSHVDVDTIGGLTPLLGVLAAARACADIADVVTIAFPQEGIARDPGAADLMVARDAGGRGRRRRDAALGGRRGRPARRTSRFCFDLAQRFDADVDMHVDETDDGTSGRSRWSSRRPSAAAGRAGSPSATSARSRPRTTRYAADVVAGCARAGITVVSNPVTNLVLQGRGDRGLVRRGTTRVRELLAAGVPVAFGQDCVDDAFYPFGRGEHARGRARQRARRAPDDAGRAVDRARRRDRRAGRGLAARRASTASAPGPGPTCSSTRRRPGRRCSGCRTRRGRSGGPGFSSRRTEVTRRLRPSGPAVSRHRCNAPALPDQEDV